MIGWGSYQVTELSKDAKEAYSRIRPQVNSISQNTPLSFSRHDCAPMTTVDAYRVTLKGKSPDQDGKDVVVIRSDSPEFAQEVKKRIERSGILESVSPTFTVLVQDKPLEWDHRPKEERHAPPKKRLLGVNVEPRSATSSSFSSHLRAGDSLTSLTRSLFNCLFDPLKRVFNAVFSRSKMRQPR
ncbi:hypothetical protein QBC40DRAFT_283503 [Triangularia verruculosa]|uniref:Uncharacterized protein n=1 Tax=Triangularia verruculosa TaxID=2587418 RepID=A0AAN7ARN5_9PEZI|nr:hypothetical protein QBC40DRAFT_283503 [Triangularia verruculosa]